MYRMYCGRSELHEAIVMDDFVEFAGDISFLVVTVVHVSGVSRGFGEIWE